MKEKLLQWLSSVWKWLAVALAAVIVVVATYFEGRSKRKDDIELEIANRELDKTNKDYAAASAQVAQIKQKQVRLVSDILAEQMRRAEEEKKREGLTDAEIDKRLADRGLLLQPPKSK